MRKKGDLADRKLVEIFVGKNISVVQLVMTYCGRAH